MEQVAFIGFYDKKDILLNIGKVFSYLGKRTLIIDATMTQRLRYIVPNISNNRGFSYVSDYQGTDVAVGFMNLGQIAAYLGTNELPYDFILVDTDNIQTMYSFMVPRMQKIFFATSYDKYEVEKSKELFANVNQPMNLTRLIVSSNISDAENEYLKHTLETNFVKFNNDREVLFEDSDKNRSVNLQNQLTKNIVFKNYKNTYKDSLEYLCALISEGTLQQGDIRKVIRKY